MNLIELRKKRAKAIADARSIVDASPTAVLSAEDAAKCDAFISEERELAKEIERREAIENADKALRSDERLIVAPTGEVRSVKVNPEQELEKEQRFFELQRRRLLGADFNDEERTFLRSFRNVENRDLNTGTGSAGGYTIPRGFVNELTEARKAFGGIFRTNHYSWKTAAGNTIDVPTENDTTNEGALLAEAAEITTQDTAFGTLTFGAYKYTSKMIKFSREMVQDSAFDLRGYLRRKTSERLGRIQAKHCTTGTGSGQPQGVTVFASAGLTAASATAITADELLDLKYSVDPAYRSNGEYMMHDTTWKNILKLKDTNGRPLINIADAGISDEGEPLLYGRPVRISMEMATPAASAVSVLYGDFSSYWVREVLDIVLVNLVERYAEYDQMAVVALMRLDAKGVNAGVAPIKKLTQAAS